jgi:solute carrier family 25 citrate transporter 1
MNKYNFPFSENKFYIAPISGSIAGAVEITTLWPFEYSKVTKQLNIENKEFSILKDIYKKGFKIYRGLIPMLIAAPAQGFIRFGTMDYFNSKFNNNGSVNCLSGLLAGLCSGIIESIFVVTPIETIKTSIIDKNNPKNISYYKGLKPTIIKSCTSQSLRFMVFNKYTNIITNDRNDKNLTTQEAICGGMLAGGIAAIINTPFDTIKTRLQSNSSEKYKGSINYCIKTMIKNEGFFSLWKGLLSRLARVVPGQGIIFSTYQYSYKYLTENYLVI